MSVFLNSLDDFITPAQACINPFVLNRKEDVPSVPAAKVTLQTDFSKTQFEKIVPKKPDLIKSKASEASKGQKVAAVSLNDCLACSGCVTSAETVLIQEQSYQKLLDRIMSNNKDDLIAVCISPQSVASVTSFLNTGLEEGLMSRAETFLRVATALKGLGVTYVLDSSSGGDVALVEAREEFMFRYRNGQVKSWVKPPHTIPASSTSVFVVPDKDNKGTSLYAPEMQLGDPVPVGYPTLDKQCLPMLASQCPGWVCYAEKTQTEALPFISDTKPAQQIIGAILKKILFNSNTTPSSSSAKSLYVVSVQPCFDKKLEGSRKDFTDEETESQEVDLVLSTTELWQLLEMRAEAEALRVRDSDDKSAPPPSVSVGNYLLNLTPDHPKGKDW
eukprot:CAMPEP_0119052856 /NCGR_PEP_ID=MMETSP1177-20130426/74012_1 /TAXON_ID=2985 /ORGANISM="Ochromonas sp, Strain CCMP1899" /LENGTH=387 /DNA_ID=CAMNT_0007032557 /DNA_START=208 /DNA_END=1368 /DNA_ORIENTATION=-